MHVCFLVLFLRLHWNAWPAMLYVVFQFNQYNLALNLWIQGKFALGPSDLTHKSLSWCVKMWQKKTLNIYHSRCSHFLLQPLYFSWPLTRTDKAPECFSISIPWASPPSVKLHVGASVTDSSQIHPPPFPSSPPIGHVSIFLFSSFSCFCIRMPLLSAAWACQRVLVTAADNNTLTFDLGWRVNFDLLKRGTWDLLNYLLLHVSMFTISPGLHRDRPCHSWQGSRVSDISQMWLNA